MTGRLIAVVGPSGVGKDSVIAGIVAGRPDIARVRRTITRPPDETEPFDGVDAATFAERLAAGAFCLHWRAHGLDYAIPTTAAEAVADGATMVANLSRGVLGEAAATFARLTVLHLTARPETLAARLAARGREADAQIAARMARRPLPAALPATVTVAEVSNDGPLAETVERALAILAGARQTGAR